jgi:mono/diheme cytochrome c family protein
LRRRGRIGTVGLAAIAALVVLLASGCGYGGVETASSHADTTNGQKLFVQACGSCHTLQAAGTQGAIGPNLDNSFAGSRLEGYDASTIENVVLDQIRLGSVSAILAPYKTGKEFTTRKCLAKATPTTPNPCTGPMMPANIVRGQDALDVAAYVAQYAGTGGYTQQVNLASLTSGADIFKLGPCGGCHTLAAAGTKGQAGPNLDGIKGLTVAIVTNQVTNGGASMPAFKSTLTAAQIQAVAQYVASVAGKK